MSQEPPPLPEREIGVGKQTMHYLVGATLFWPVSAVALALFHVDLVTKVADKLTSCGKTSLATDFIRKTEDIVSKSKYRKAGLIVTNTIVSVLALKYYQTEIPKVIEKTKQDFLEQLEEQQRARYGDNNTEPYKETNWQKRVSAPEDAKAIEPKSRA